MRSTIIGSPDECNAAAALRPGTSERQDAVQQVERAPFPGGLESPERVQAQESKIAGSTSLRRTERHAVRR